MMTDKAPIHFLNLDDVIYLHYKTIARYGGAAGVRDEHLLESAEQYSSWFPPS